jgi:hypothetical protein
MLARLGRAVIIEWVPKPDPQVQRLLRSREDIFESYHVEALRAAFTAVGLAERRVEMVGDSGRTLHLFAR